MIHLELQPGTEAELAARAQAHGVTVERCIEDIVLERLAEDGLRQGLEEIAAGQTYSADEVFSAFRKKHAIQN